MHISSVAILALLASGVAAQHNVRIQGTNVNARECPHTGCKSLTKLSNKTVYGVCQTRGELVKNSNGYENDWWSKVVIGASKTAWVSNLYIQGGRKIAGIPDCSPCKQESC
ncbi:uncharacterized protein EV422DRAFT_345212 [Fimicolochytrium jonesii]|uniref:uncharacterized protein n=1 Tax=Fimicolochytrium jonesii TaxID=1396493 RepID=UPI0022FE6304|nr:uncharacterized protein EV422DRAFT_345212 [Fimicolochytrium jonesii]KAI8815794.1 hypothetical protein EV422DRAFT_345212 [Fimicolochytrium jonesii]